MFLVWALHDQNEFTGDDYDRRCTMHQTRCSAYPQFRSDTLDNLLKSSEGRSVRRNSGIVALAFALSPVFSDCFVQVFSCV